MKIFVSHSSQFKPTIKIILKYLPANITSWLDENDLVWGDKLAPTFETAIKGEVDYVLLFVNESSGRSEWVRKEVKWALEKERDLGRIFLLPIVIQSGDENGLLYFPELSERKCIILNDFTEFGLKAVAEQLTSGLFALICNDLNRIQMPKPIKTTQAIDNADVAMSQLAMIIRKAVFPHRQDNPISVEDLFNITNEYSEDKIGYDEFENLLEKITQRNLIPGLSYDGYELFLKEEHSLWKSNLNHEKKVAIARKAASYLKNGMKVYIDAGSTTAEIVKIICKRIETRTLTKITIIISSTNQADMIAGCCVKMGFDDDFTAVDLYIPGGKVRPSTQALISISNDISEIERIDKEIGGIDLAFIGVNGVTLNDGLTTYNNKEAFRKKEAYRLAKTRIIVCDDSKLGIKLDAKIADFTDDVTVIINNEQENSELSIIKEKYPDTVKLA